MMVDENVNGVLVTALRQQTESFTLAQTELISKMARDLAGLNEYATFLERSRALVAAEERNRLARDLHDSVTQVLFSASLVAEVLPTIWQRDPERAAESLEELRRLTRGALAEMRTMLLELRPSAVSKSPLHDLLAQLTEASTSRTELSFRLALEKTPRLPENVHASFYRVAQEALNNVAKHARASQVTLELHVNPQKPEQAGERRVELRLVVEDDGTGFSPENEQQLGLGIMRERAADIQADLTIDSRIGEGTCVSLVWCGIIKTNHE
jgi:signal transduction histidine kinase